jgi:hypothetical protein
VLLFLMMMACGGGPPSPVVDPIAPEPPSEEGASPPPGMPTETTAGPENCGLVFSPDNANEVYGTLGAIQSTGCEFEGVKTAKATMAIQWKDDAGVIELSLRPDSCVDQKERTLVRSHGLALLDAADRGDRCGAAVAATVKSIRTAPLTTPMPPTATP